MGQSAEKGLPESWGGKENANILWKTPLPHFDKKLKADHNQSSPIVWADRIFVTTSFWGADKTQKEYPEHHLTCYATDGTQKWDAKVEPGLWLLSDLRGGYTAPTPATDGERVYALFGSGVIAAFDLNGGLLWRKEIPEPKKFDVAIGASPILYGDMVVILCDKGNKAAHLLALDKITGDVKYDERRPNVQFSHTTPVLAKIDGKDTLLIGAGGQLQGVDPANGQVRWWAANDGDVPCPVLGAGLVYCDSGRGGGFGIAVEPIGVGDLTKTRIKWKTDKKIGGLGSPVVSGEYLYRLREPGLLTIYEMSSGKLLSEERVQGVSMTASPIATAEGRVYFGSAGALGCRQSRTKS